MKQGLSQSFFLDSIVEGNTTAVAQSKRKAMKFYTNHKNNHS